MSNKQNDEYYEQARERADELKEAKAERPFKLEQQTAMEMAQAKGEQEYFDGAFAELYIELSDLIHHLTDEQLDKIEFALYVERNNRRRKADQEVAEYADELPF